MRIQIQKSWRICGQNVVEEVDNSLTLPATRVISHTSIGKDSPVDIDITRHRNCDKILLFN